MVSPLGTKVPSKRMASGDGSKDGSNTGAALAACHEPLAGATLMGKLILVFVPPRHGNGGGGFFLGKWLGGGVDKWLREQPFDALKRTCQDMADDSEPVIQLTCLLFAAKYG